MKRFIQVLMVLSLLAVLGCKTAAPDTTVTPAADEVTPPVESNTDTEMSVTVDEPETTDMSVTVEE